MLVLLLPYMFSNTFTALRRRKNHICIANGLTLHKDKKVGLVHSYTSLCGKINEAKKVNSVSPSVHNLGKSGKKTITGIFFTFPRMFLKNFRTQGRQKNGLFW